jgi:hypothetical protein
MLPYSFCLPGFLGLTAFAKTAAAGDLESCDAAFHLTHLVRHEIL